ncbi:hypothetical protein [Paraburkholderia phenoliruptrix]|uniref:hypothetical protein n=1 Tax=Paraburkholderia phenoliruptrix TaxID=252970 RepID=UPI002869AE22|nr:hypothetical protein [Paraburkholderia phenoliruptrix]WMY10963.1 hypothetical protein P3F88_30250 [Paraburkholderia phenoliruptrix]
MRQEWLEQFQRISLDAPTTVALVSSAVSSVVTLAWIAAWKARERKRRRSDTALELALSLEKYTRTCRIMMHKAAWAAAEPCRSEASKGVSVPPFAYPDGVHWDVLSRRVVSELREYPATVHGAREYVEAFREFGEPIDVCAQVEFECAKAAISALALARTTRRRHGAAAWKPGAKDSALERDLASFIKTAEENGQTLLERRRESMARRRTGEPSLNQVPII